MDTVNLEMLFDTNSRSILQKSRSFRGEYLSVFFPSLVTNFKTAPSFSSAGGLYSSRIYSLRPSRVASSKFAVHLKLFVCFGLTTTSNSVMQQPSQDNK